MTNKTKDKILIIIIFLVVFFVGFFVAKAFAQIQKVNSALLEEYKNRPTIIRSETEEDRKDHRMWRQQYAYQYDIDIEEVDECLKSWDC